MIRTSSHILKWNSKVKESNRKHGSHNHEQTCKEIKNYINQVVNQIEWGNYSVCVTEDITNITQNTKQKRKTNKNTRKLLSHWNQRYLLDRIKLRCEDNRVLFASINPAYTSQTCSVCNHIDSNSRNGEVFKCTHCDIILDADYNASINILNRYLDGKLTVSRGTETFNCMDNHVKR
jgi:IS605 OrfB family transposase